MKFYSEQLASGKWGIYSSDKRLLATVVSEAMCELVLANLATGRRDVPDDDANQLYKAHKLRREVLAEETSPQSERLADRQLSEELKVMAAEVEAQEAQRARKALQSKASVKASKTSSRSQAKAAS